MADSKITALTSIGTSTDPANDPLVLVDVSDTSMAATGTTKKVTLNNLLACSPTATLASATITGAATVGTTLGVTGVSTFAAGTALLPALTTTGDTNTGIYYPAADTFAVTTGGTERYRVDSSGNVGVGITPSAWGAGYKCIQIASSQSTALMGSGNQTELTTNAFFDTGWKYQGAGTVAASRYSQQSGVHYWFTAAAGAANAAITDFATAKMTLNASGNLLVARTGAGLDNTSGVTIGQASIGMQTEGNATQIVVNRTTSDGTIVDIRRNNVTVGSISVTTTATTYNTSSDYRLKESAQPLVGGLARVNALKPSIYKWKVNGSTGEGFIAHELAETVPFAVTGDKDAVDADGNPTYQGVDLSKLVPILVAAIQELTARVQTLEAR
jgi:hypothetical protein